MVNERLAGGSGQREGELIVDIRYRAAKHGRFPFCMKRINPRKRLLFRPIDNSPIPFPKRALVPSHPPAHRRPHRVRKLEVRLN